jgi:hypothetical protein
MIRPRVSLSGLIVCVVACALGLAALRNASPPWAGSMLLLTLGLFAVDFPTIGERSDKSVSSP